MCQNENKSISSCNDFGIFTNVNTSSFSPTRKWKKNEKFEFFELLCSGTTSGDSDKSWYTPPNADPLDNKTQHTRGGGWTTGEIVELTVGDETFTTDTNSYYVTWTTHIQY